MLPYRLITCEPGSGENVRSKGSTAWNRLSAAGGGRGGAARKQAERMVTELVVRGTNGQGLRRDSDGGDPGRRPH